MADRRPRSERVTWRILSISAHSGAPRPRSLIGGLQGLQLATPRGVREERRRPVLWAERWPIIFVAPVFVYAGYTGWHVLALTVAAAVLAELAFAIVRIVLLDRDG